MNMVPSHFRKRGFTLIELMVVISIIAVLFIVAMPVWENIGKKDTKKAAIQLMTTLRLARQHAVAKRQWTLVVFPTTTFNAERESDLKKQMRSYAVLGVTNDMAAFIRTEQTPDNMKFEFISDWRYFSDGVYLEDDTALKEYWLLREQSPKFKYPLFPGASDSDSVPMAVLLFRPNGRAYVMKGVSSEDTKKYWQDTEARIFLTSRKVYLKDKKVMKASPVEIDGARLAIQINNKTGQVKLLEDEKYYQK